MEGQDEPADCIVPHIEDGEPGMGSLERNVFGDKQGAGIESSW
jgi:hypothetical protein